MKIPIYKVALVIGYEKAGVSGARGQLVKAEIGRPDNDERMEIQIGEPEGVWMHGRTKEKKQWWMSVQWLCEGDLVYISVKVGIAGVGTDEDRTADYIFQVDPSVAVIEFGPHGVGFKDYFIAKGRLRMVAGLSKAEERQVKQIEPLATEEFADPRYMEVPDA